MIYELWVIYPAIEEELSYEQEIENTHDIHAVAVLRSLMERLSLSYMFHEEFDQCVQHCLIV